VKISTLMKVLAYFNNLSEESNIYLNLAENSEYDDDGNGYKCDREELIICDPKGDILFYIQDWETDEDILNNLKEHKKE